MVKRFQHRYTTGFLLCFVYFFGEMKAASGQAGTERPPRALFFPQLTNSSNLKLAHGSANDSSEVLGSSFSTINKLIETVAPQLQSCKPLPRSSSQNGLIRHLYFGLECFGLEVDAFEIGVHLKKDQNLGGGEKIVGLSLPGELDLILPPQLEDLGVIMSFSEASAPYASTGIVKSLKSTNSSTANKVQPKICFQENIAVPCWQFLWRASAESPEATVTVDATTGNTIHEFFSSFEMRTNTNTEENLYKGQVYLRSPVTDEIAERDLFGVNGDNLESRFFLLNTSEGGLPTPHAENNVFSYDSSGETAQFDQVQAMFGVGRALQWFQKRFGYDIGATKINVIVHTVIDNTPNNALYTPAKTDYPPEILIGAGDNRLMQRLARDNDVITHEFSHHIIFRRLTSRTGESLILHEGSADYFTYALNNDPYLAKSIMINRPFLRSAVGDANLRMDNPNFADEAHMRGQIWSAMLWDIRGEIGDRVDDLLFHAIDYWSENAGFREAILGILQADRDMNPLPEGNAERGIFGLYKCAILTHAIARGFATFIADVSPAGCNLSLSDAAQASRSYTDSQADKDGNDQPRGKNMSFTVAGRKCSVVGGEASHSTESQWWSLALIMIPLLCALRPSRSLKKEQEHDHAN